MPSYKTSDAGKQVKSGIPPSADTPVTVIKPQTGWKVIDVKELARYKDLLLFLIWRDIKARYAQSILGVGWAVIQPVFRMIVFTIIFGKLAKINSDGVPYAVFSYVALVPWGYFSNALTGATSSLIGSSNMLTKVYFPRLIIPLSAVTSKLVDFIIASGITLILVLWYRITPTAGIVFTPVLVIIMVISAAGLGMWLTALAVQYRDVNYALGFVVQLLMYAAPVVYPVSLIPEKYRLFYALNPMVGVIEGFRSAILGTVPMPWEFIGAGSAVAVIVFIGGILYFSRMERNFADVV